MIKAFFETCTLTREEAEDEAEQRGMSLAEYCETAVVSVAVKTASTHFLGMALSLLHPELHPTEVLVMAQSTTTDIWGKPDKETPLRSVLANAIGHTAAQASLIISETLAKIEKGD